MQHTTKYNFNLIDTSDPFGPEALNENTRAVEDKLAALEAADNALAVADLALAQADADNKSQLQAAIQKAQSAADAAQATANTARAEAAVLPYKVGTYTGNSGTQTIEVGFRPSLLIVSHISVIYNTNTASLAEATLITSGTLHSGLVSFTDTGFTVRVSSSITYPKVNANYTYCYIAFR